VINGLQHIFKKWLEHCKKCIACQGRYLEKESITPPQSSDSRLTKVSPQTLQMALVHGVDSFLRSLILIQLVKKFPSFYVNVTDNSRRFHGI
jgi:hypothetical protein